MNEYGLFEEKAINAIGALTSGVLTSLIYDGITKSSYLVKREGINYIIYSIGTNPWSTIVFVLLMFCLIWASITIALPQILVLKKRISYARIPRFKQKELLKIIENSKVTTIRLMKVFSEDTKDNDLQILYFRDITRTVLVLHRSFCPRSKIMKKRVEQFFRTKEHSTIYSIDRKGSGYEFIIVIKMLRQLIEQVKNTQINNLLFDKDYKQVTCLLNELDNFAQNINRA